MNRRQILKGLPAVAVLPPMLGGLIRPAAAQDVALREGDRVLGESEAPVTIIEYSSLTCPHCARFHREILPEVKSEWIEEGRAKLAYRHFPLDGLALRAAMVANAMPTDRAFFAFIEVLFETQAQWSQAQDPLEALARHAQLAGLSQERFNAAVEDEPGMNAILEGFVEARDEFGVNSTPTFFANGEKVEGVGDYESFARVLDAA
ncbi:DsbA family protein [Aquibaculum sediminis]|uniref:DsbA family protein n=1 Tax=Aquibaculum sediminis TaxID=3231907 RepID=UPI0034519791